jgi:D-specific alpha-keto acid dehydrogenase
VTYSDPVRTGVHPTRRLVSSSSWSGIDPLGGLGEQAGFVPRLGITVFGCDEDEASLFREMAPRFGIQPVVTSSAVSEASIELAFGTRCVSVDHKTQVSSRILLALREAGVIYLSSRSVGYNHIDMQCAESIGVSVENVSYSSNSVADYTLMLILMTVRNSKSTTLRVQTQDYRLNDVRGKELSDMTIGVIGTGRIGGAVIERLRGFGCQVVAHDSSPKSAAEHVPLDELLQRSDVVTLHTPLAADTHHLLDRQRIGQMRHGAFIVNTARGALIDTEALLPALENGELGGAALDVVEGEEGIFYTDRSRGQVDNALLLRLQRLPNVIITPHTAYYTERAVRDAVENTLRNCQWFERKAAWRG